MTALKDSQYVKNLELQLSNASRTARNLARAKAELVTEVERLKGMFQSARNTGCDATCLNYCWHADKEYAKELAQVTERVEQLTEALRDSAEEICLRSCENRPHEPGALLGRVGGELNGNDGHSPQCQRNRAALNARQAPELKCPMHGVTGCACG